MTLYHKTVSKLLDRYQKYILSSIYQNCVYNGQPLYEYYGKLRVSNKPAPCFEQLLNKILQMFLPPFNPQWLHDKAYLKKIDNLYVSQYMGFMKIKDLLSLSSGDEFVIDCAPPSFFSRSYKLKIYNRVTQGIRWGYVPTNKLTPLMKRYKELRVWAGEICQHDFDMEIYKDLRKSAKPK